MIKNLTLGFATFALAVGSAATSYTVTFYEPVVINNTTLKPGDYRVELKNNTAVIKQGRTLTEAPVKVENNADRFSNTVVRINKAQVEEIRVGGTHTRIVFEKTGEATN